MDVKENCNTHFFYFIRFSVQSLISELEAVMLSDYLRKDGRTQCFLETAALFRRYSYMLETL